MNSPFDFFVIQTGVKFVEIDKAIKELEKKTKEMEAEKTETDGILAGNIENLKQEFDKTQEKMLDYVEVNSDMFYNLEDCIEGLKKELFYNNIALFITGIVLLFVLFNII